MVKKVSIKGFHGSLSVCTSWYEEEVKDVQHTHSDFCGLLRIGILPKLPPELPQEFTAALA